MAKIVVRKNPSDEELIELRAYEWPTWTREVSEFPWTYDQEETCFFIRGEVEVTPDGGAPVRMGKNDLVTFPAGMSCTWKILADVEKRYTFS